MGLRAGLLQVRGAAQQHAGPRAVVDLRNRVFLGRDLVEVDAAAVVKLGARVVAFRRARDVAHDAVEERAETRLVPLVGAAERPAFFDAVDQHLLGSVGDLVSKLRATPARAEIGADHRSVDRDERVAVL